MKSIFTPFILAILMACGISKAQHAAPAAKADSLFTEWNKPGMPGAAVGVVHRGKLIYAKGFGEADLETGARIGPETIFHVASVSKQFTAFAIVLLAGEGKLSLDDDIHKYIPEVPDFGKTITIRHLLNHTSGLRDQWNLLAMAGWQLDDVITNQHVQNLVTRQKELNFEPGSAFAYCNTGYTLLAEIVSRVTKQPFTSWMERTVFKPLGMKNTQFFDNQEGIVKGRAYSFHRTHGTPGPTMFSKSILSYGNVGATSLFTTINDLALWINNFRSPKVGTAATMKQMLEQGRLTKGDTLSYASGLIHGKHKGLAFYGHDGADAGFRSSLMYFPKEDYGFIVLSNQAEFFAGMKNAEVADIYLKSYIKEAKPAVVAAPPAEQPAARVAPQDGPAIPAAQFTGKYYSPELETIYTIALKDETLKLIHVHHGEADLKVVNKDRLQAPRSWWFVGNIDIVRSDNGSITGLKMSNGRVENLWFKKLDENFDR